METKNNHASSTQTDLEFLELNYRKPRPREIELKIESCEIKATNRKLKAVWTMERIQDVKPDAEPFALIKLIRSRYAPNHGTPRT